LEEQLDVSLNTQLKLFFWIAQKEKSLVEVVFESTA
jgi:hypothetical protein